jgi:hypothetical protein
MASDLQRKMLQRRSPLTNNTPAVMAIPDPSKPKPDTAAPQPKPQQEPQPSVLGNGVVTQPTFDLPDPNKKTTLADLVKLTQDGDKVSAPRSRPMTPQEIESVKAGVMPDMRLSDLERRNLIKAGWEEGTPVPAGFPEALQGIITEYLNQKRSEGVAFDKIKIRDISDLPPEEQIKVQAAFQNLMKQDTARRKREEETSNLNEYPESIRNEIQKIQTSDLPVIETETKPTPAPVSVPVPVLDPEPTPVPNLDPKPMPVVMTQESPELEPPQETQPRPYIQYTGLCPTCGCDPNGGKRILTCVHCGCDPLEDPDQFEISIEDKRAFLTAVATGHPFQKGYKIFNGVIYVRFRSLKAMEYEHLTLWSTKRAAQEAPPRGEAYREFLDRAQYYELMGGLALQIVLLESSRKDSELCWFAPEGKYAGLKEWKEQYGVDGFDDLLIKFQESIESESVLAALRTRLIEFNRLDYRLTREGTNTENFWEGT